MLQKAEESNFTIVIIRRFFKQPALTEGWKWLAAFNFKHCATVKDSPMKFHVILLERYENEMFPMAQKNYLFRDL